MNLGRKPLLLALTAVLLASASNAATAPAIKPLAPSAVVAKPVAAVALADKDSAGVESALALAAEGLKGGCETARNSGESPFRTLQDFSIKPTIVAAAFQRCPDGTKWACHPWCNEYHPTTGKCVFWVPACACE